MNNNTLYLSVLFVVLIASQALIFDNLVLFNTAVPFVFVYLILSLPVTMGTNLAMTIAFAAGMCVDAFTDTYGMNALAATVTAFAQKPVFNLYESRDEDLGGQCPGVRSMGAPVYMKYAVTLLLIYCTLAFVIEAFGFFSPLRMLLRIVCSTAYTFLIIYAVDSLSLNRSEKRL